MKNYTLEELDLLIRFHMNLAVAEVLLSIIPIAYAHGIDASSEVGSICLTISLAFFVGSIHSMLLALILWLKKTIMKGSL